MKRSTRYRYRSERRKWFKFALLGASAVCLIIAGTLLVRYVRHAAQASNTQEELRQEYLSEPAGATPVAETRDNPVAAPEPEEDTTPQAPRAMLLPGAAMRAEFVSLYGKNNDLVGWLRSDALPEIDLSVVQRDNAFYMDHDFYGRRNLAGTVFLDQSCQILPRSNNLVLHGHNMKNGSMFGKLHLYLGENAVKAQPSFTFSTLYESSVYVPYAVSLVSTNPNSPRFTAFVQSGFRDGDDMQSYAINLKELSRLEFPVDLRADDRLLTLSTCYGKEDSERLIVALRELRPGENKEAVERSIREGLIATR